jgi:hypothetical protein
MLSVNRTLSFAWRFIFLNRFFSLALVGYVDNLYITSVSMCQVWVSLFWVMNQSKWSIPQSKEMSRLSPETN